MSDSAFSMIDRAPIDALLTPAPTRGSSSYAYAAPAQVFSWHLSAEFVAVS